MACTSLYIAENSVGVGVALVERHQALSENTDKQ